MIYLLSQMLIALAIAALMGAAIGWLIHRASHNRLTATLRQALARQQQQVAQAQSDVAMLNEDYDELKNQTQAKITALQQDNRQIPFLNTNLEKSQLLVRQMIQKHDAQQRELIARNEKLVTKIRQHEEREQMKNQVEAELDSLRRERASTDADTSSDDNGNNLPLADSFPHDSTQNNPASSQPFLPPSAEITAETTAGMAVEAAAKTAPARFVAAEATDDPFDEVMEVEDDLQFVINEHDQTRDDSPEQDSPADTGQMDFELPAQKPDSSDSQEPVLDGSIDASVLFEPGTRQDDLQQIFGIGPVTEQALNDLGITSYSQLAELQHHEIQKIADALEIVPGRIERDNWVGSARRQLEEVLEQL